jgi:hypothetical protein
MPLNKANCRRFHRFLYCGQLISIVLNKRGDDQNQGQTTSFVLNYVRRSQMVKSGQTLQKEMSSNHRCSFHIPREELDRVGVAYLNALDQYVDDLGTWQAESNEPITVKLFSDHVCVECVRRDPLTPVVGV